MTTNERAAMDKVLIARIVFEATIRVAMGETDMMKDDLQCLLNAVDDHCPTEERWEEKMAEA